MARRRRILIPGYPLHLVQRGVDRMPCFRHRRDYAIYLGLLEELAHELRCAVHAYVLMTNHVHLLVTPRDEGAVSILMKRLGQRYAQHCNKSWPRTGHLWEGRFRSCVVERDSYALGCQRYIEMNPVRAGMVSHPGHYPWSSYGSSALGIASTLITPNAAYLALGSDASLRRAAYRALFEVAATPRELDEIRSALQAEMGLGSVEFLERIGREAGRELRRDRRPAMHQNEAIRGQTPVEGGRR
jgi:putative transposase